MATNTSATSQNHNGTGSQANFAISFPFLLNSEIEVTVGGVLKTLGNHYNIVGSEVQFTSGNIPASGTANIVFNRDTNISTKRVDFEDGSVLTEADLDNNVNQVLFAQQELSNDYVKRDGTQTVTGNLVFEGSADDANETTLSITNPTADRTITVPDRSGTIITSGDTGTVTNTMLAGNSVDSSKIIDGSIVNADVNASANISGSKLQAASSSNAGSMSASDKAKLDNIESGATADQDASEIRSLVESASDSNVFTDADHSKLDGIESNATQDQTASEIRTLIASDPLTSTHLAANSVDSSELVDGSVDHSHLSNDCVDGDNVQDDSIDSEHIVAGSLDNEHYAAGSITSDKLNGATVITASEQGSATTNDTSFLTSAAADARFFNISSGDTIKNGDTFPDNDTTIATTAAINDRIIDLIDDVGGFTIIASEQAFPDVNPQGVTGQAAVLSIKAATTNLVPSGTTVTVVNGNVADNANITITGVPSTIPSGFGFLVESTSTLHRYSFHRLVPKATEVTTVAGKAVEIGRLGTADAVADMAILGTTDVVADMNTLATADIVSDMNTLATTDVVNDMNTLAVTSVINNMDTVATNVTNVNNVGNNITNVNNLTNSTGANQTFTVTVQNVSGNKYFIDGVQTPVLKLARGKTYTFNLADSSNSGHPLAFRDSSDNSYTTGVTTSGTAGSSGATVVIVVAANAPSSLKYYCTSHGNAMGNTINVIDDNVGAVAGALTNVGLVGGSITNVNNVGNSISNVNTVASNISSVNSFFNLYRIGSSNPTSSLDTGDLFFNTSTNSLKVYTGSAWVDGVTTTGDFALKTGNTFTGSNIHNDNVKSFYGTGSDLEVFHDGTNSEILSKTGFLRLRNNTSSGVLYLQSAIIQMQPSGGGEVIFDGRHNGSVKLYYDNSKKFETKSNGVLISGELQSTHLNITGSSSIGGDVYHADNVKARFGTGSDLLIYHNGTDSFIDNSTGGLKILGDTIRLKGKSVDENMLVASANGAVDLYYDNSKKFETTSSGVDVTGHLNCTGTLTCGELNSGTQIVAGNPTLRLRTTNNSLANKGTIEFYYNTSNLAARIRGKSRNGANGQLYLDVEKAGTMTNIVYVNDSTVDITGNLNVSNGADITGNITVTGTVDGVDIAALNTTVSNITTDVVSDTSPQLGGELQTNGNDISFADDDRATFGAGDDLRIFHNGSDNFISGTGNLYLKNSGFLDIRSDGNETMIKATPNGSVVLYYDNSKKLDTYADGVRISSDGNTGRLVLADTNGNFAWQLTGFDAGSAGSGGRGVFQDANGGMVLDMRASGGNIHSYNTIKLNGAGTADNLKVTFGASDDLQLYHDGSNSRIHHGGSGGLKLTAADFQIMKNDGSEFMARFLEDGAAELYHNGTKHFETTSTGVIISGRLSTSNSGAFMTLSDSSPYGFIIDQSASRNITIRTDGDNINLNQRTNGEYYIRCIKNTDVKVFYDGSQKLGTTSTGVSITGRATFSQPYAAYYGVNNASGTSGWKNFQWRVQQERRSINHSNSITNFTPQVAGWYLVVLNHYHQNGTHSDYYLRILRNNSVNWGYRKFDNAFSGNLSAVMYFNGSSDYFNMGTYHSNSAHPDQNDELTNFACIYLTA